MELRLAILRPPGRMQDLEALASGSSIERNIRNSTREPKPQMNGSYGELGKETNMNARPVDASRWSRSGSSWVNILLGIWVIVSPFVLAFHSPKAVWSNVITGAVIGILALIRWSMHQPGWSWLNLILGIWLVISPFVLFASGVAMWNNVIVGIIIAASALTNTYFKESA
jgi:SPW repeat